MKYSFFQSINHIFHRIVLSIIWWLMIFTNYLYKYIDMNKDRLFQFLKLLGVADVTINDRTYTWIRFYDVILYIVIKALL